MGWLVVAFGDAEDADGGGGGGGAAEGPAVLGGGADGGGGGCRLSVRPSSGRPTSVRLGALASCQASSSRDLQSPEMKRLRRCLIWLLEMLPSGKWRKVVTGSMCISLYCSRSLLLALRQVRMAVLRAPRQLDGTLGAIRWLRKKKAVKSAARTSDLSWSVGMAVAERTAGVCSKGGWPARRG